MEALDPAKPRRCGLATADVVGLTLRRDLDPRAVGWEELTGIPGTSPRPVFPIPTSGGHPVAMAHRSESDESEDWHEDVNDVVAPVVLERWPCVVRVRPLREALRGGADLFVDAGSLTVQADAGVTAARQCPTLGPDRRRIVTGTEHRAHAVCGRRRVERPVQLSPA